MSELKKIDPLSHSKSASYSNCERKFSFNYLESIKEPSGIHAAVGTYVHSVIENFYDSEKAKNPYFDWNGSSNYLLDIHANLWKKHKKYLSFLFDKEKSKVNNSFKSIEEWINQLILNYIELEDWIQNDSDLLNLKFSKEAPLINDLNISNELYVKQEIKTDKNSFVLRGYIDRLQETKNGNKVIIDIKTGKPPSSLDSEKSDQIKSYALLYGEEHVEEGYIYFLGEKNISPEKRIFKVAIKDIDENRKYYVKTFDSMTMKSEFDIENYSQEIFADVWKSKINPFCNWCFYKNGCPEWVKVYQNKDLSKLLNKFYSKLRHKGGVSKLEKEVQEEIVSIFAKFKDLDLDIQQNLQSLFKNQLQDLLNSITSLNNIKKQNSVINEVLNKVKNLINEVSEVEPISLNKELLDKFIIPNQKAIVQLNYEMPEEKLWQSFTKIIKNLQNEQISSQLGDYEDNFNDKIEDLRRDWILWKDFKEISRFSELNIKNLIEEFMEFKLYRKNTISLLKKKPFIEFLMIYHDEFNKILELEIQDLYFAENVAEDHLFNLKKLTSEVLEKLKKIINLQKELEENVSKLSKINIS